jgi:hypothetical protein
MDALVGFLVDVTGPARKQIGSAVSYPARPVAAVPGTDMSWRITW